MAIVFYLVQTHLIQKLRITMRFTQSSFGTLVVRSAFALIIPILSGFIARSIADKPGFASGLLGEC